MAPSARSCASIGRPLRCTGRGGSVAPTRRRASVSERAAARVIVETARAHPGEVLLVATGPLTNVARALSEEPGLPALLGGFALMGGAYARAGNITPAAEANIWVDPEAAASVFRAFSGAAVLPLCVGLDVTQQVRMTTADLEAVCAPAPSSALAAFLHDAVGFYIEFYERSGSSKGASMHDPLALAIALDPSLAELRTARVEVECDGRWTRGMTVANFGEGRQPEGWPQDRPENRPENRENARVALGVDAGAFSARFQERLRGLVEARA